MHISSYLLCLGFFSFRFNCDGYTYFLSAFVDGDSDGSFGGDIEPSIFNNPALFDDPTTTNQLATLAEGLTLPGEPDATGTDGGVKEGGVMDVDVMDTSMGPKSNGAPSQVQNQPGSIQNQSGGRNESSEAFALMPIDVPVAVAEPRRRVLF